MPSSNSLPYNSFWNPGGIRGGGVSNPVDLGKYLFGREVFPQQEFLRGAQRQNTYMTPEQFSTLFRQLTAPAIDTLGRQYGAQSRNLAASFANRGQLFGGSLTGAQAQLGAGHEKALSDLLAGVGGQLGTLDLQLGAQRQAQATQLLQALFSQILGGEYGVAAARAGRPKQGFDFGGLFSGLGGLAGGAAELIPVL